MKGTSSTIIALRALLVCLTFIALFVPVNAQALEFVVNPNKSGGCLTTDNCYTTIQAAIDEADRRLNLVGNTDSFTILVEPGTYPGPITLKPNIPVRGRETARTILTGGGNGTVVTANSTVTGVTFKNFTITSAAIGIDVSGGSSLTITNNIFQVGTGSSVIAVRVQSTASAATSVTNNTFYQNGIALSTSQSIQINNNIFSNFSTAISTSGQEVSLITHNAFTVDPLIPNLVFSGGIGGVQNRIVSDPKFVNTSQGDFHLQATSECIDRGTGTDIIDNTTADIGAYGGSADNIPFRVQGLNVTGTTSNSISITWTTNESYLITTDNINATANPRGYRIYYDSDASGPPYNGTDAKDTDGVTALPSPIKINLRTQSAPPYTLSGLTASVSVPAVPTLNNVSFANETLVLEWSQVTGATSYKVYYGTTSPPTTSIPVGNTTSYRLTGLTNGTHYFVAVTAVAQPTYYVAVTAYDNTNQTLSPGESHESAYSDELAVTIGTAQESALSTIVEEYPESIDPFPPLPNQGCFIATAAYGYYSAPQVMALREFRDRYLMTNGPGRAFVQLYYRVSPPAAQFITEHPSLKPVVRVGLAPAVGTALFMTGTSSAVKLLVFMMMLSLALYVRRKRINRLPEEGTGQ